MKNVIITAIQKQCPIDPKTIPTPEQISQSVKICKKSDLVRLDKNCFGLKPGKFCIICGISGKGISHYEK